MARPAATLSRVYIVGAMRTPIGSFQGVLSTIPAPTLGAHAVTGALKHARVDPAHVDEVFFGQVLSAGCGQAPARQCALGAGLPVRVPCTTVNKVCASGIKAVMLGAQAIQTGHAGVAVCGGMENMSRVPHLLPGLRSGTRLGPSECADALTSDGLTDAYDHCHMGVCADEVSAAEGLTREEQDAYALQSYRRAQAAWASGHMAREVVAVPVPGRRGQTTMVTTDEEPARLQEERVPTLRAAFSKTGTTTAANASKLNDGAAAVVLASAAAVERYGLVPLAQVLAFADAAIAPRAFPLAPVPAIAACLARAQVSPEQVAIAEINEAFSSVPILVARKAGIPLERVNPDGGAVALGHPIGMSGARLIVHLCHGIQSQQDSGSGPVLAAICNGGGGASAMLLGRP